MEILRRYKNNIEAIHSGESDAELRVSEISHILDLQKAFYLINYYKQVTDSKNQGLFNNFVFKKIEEIFIEYQKYLLETGDVNYNEFKDFTATVMLKLEHRRHLIFNKYTIQGYSSMPTAVFERSFDDAVKVFYEFIDSLLVIPYICKDLSGISLENCLRKEFTQLIVDFRTKYQLKDSISGSQLDSFLAKSIKRISTALKDEDSY